MTEKQKASLILSFFTFLICLSFIFFSCPSFAAVDSSPQQIAGVKCFPWCERRESDCEQCRAAQKETLQNSSTKTHSSVNTVQREYNRDHVDLSIKVPGGSIEIHRRYYADQWYWEHTRNSLSFNMDSLGTGIASIDKGGVLYKASSTDTDIFTHDIYRIVKQVDGSYRWEDKSGAWKEFDDQGRMTSYGSRTGVVGKLLYEAGDDGRLIGIVDRDDNQALWLEYNGEERLSAIYDIDNRRVEYEYTDNLLTKVTDLLGNETTYQYDGSNRINKTIDAAGRESVVSYDEYDNVASVVDSQGKGHFFEFDYDNAKNEQYVRITTSSV